MKIQIIIISIYITGIIVMVLKSIKIYQKSYTNAVNNAKDDFYGTRTLVDDEDLKPLKSGVVFGIVIGSMYISIAWPLILLYKQIFKILEKFKKEDR